MDLTYRLINVFADGQDRFSGNAICVFEDAAGLSDEQMQRLAQQMNLETVFIVSGDEKGGNLRFFSPEKETTFAGSASLGTAYVLRQLHGGSGEMQLSAPGRDATTVRNEGEDWVIQARPAKTRKLKSTPQILSSLVGLSMDAIDGEVMVVDSGRSGVVLPVRTVDHVERTRLDARMLHSYAMLLNTEPQIYVWAHRDQDTIESRMFYGPGGGVLEVAATGSGAANLGHWMAAHGEHGVKRIRQGGRAV